MEFADDVTVIAVNGAITRLGERADFWFTLDPSRDNIQLMKKPVAGVTYYAAVPNEFKQHLPHVKLLRRITGDGHGRYMTRGGLAPDRGHIHTGNSAWGALQLAVHMDATRVALFGLDGFGSYYYGGKPRNLSMMPDLFRSATDELLSLGISVVNGSKQSEIDCFERMHVKDALSWIRER